MQQKELLAFLKSEYEKAKKEYRHLFYTKYHGNDEIYDCLHALLSEYGKEDDEISIDTKIDNLYEICNSKKPIYHSIAEWFFANYEAVNKYIEEFGVVKNDILKTIQFAYCYTLENEAREGLEDMILSYNNNH